jgi:carbonic anhydrase/acetyltransferase-like protein (isoleucine patch superfamily)
MRAEGPTLQRTVRWVALATLLTTNAAAAHAQHAASATAAPLMPACDGYTPLSAGAALAARAGTALASFVDPTVQRVQPERVRIGCRVYIAPFVTIDPHGSRMTVGHASNLQDNVSLTGAIVIGDGVSIAHGATIRGPARVGATDGRPAFVGFNSLIDGATVEADAMVTHLAKVSAGIIIHAGWKVLPGKWIRTQAEADDPALGKVVAMTEADRDFMRGVLHVNNALAAGYAALARRTPTTLRGAGKDPGHSDFNTVADQPAFLGKAVPHPSMHVRVIGGVQVGETWRALDARAGRVVSIRADEGEHFAFGPTCVFGDRVTFHALEHSGLEIGTGVHFGEHVVVHGGPDGLVTPKDVTRIGNETRIGPWAVVFRSTVGARVQIGERSYIDGSHIPDGTVIPPGTIMIGDQLRGVVEW